jgi:Fe-S oxidoreductase
LPIKRSMPTLYKTTLLSWYKQHQNEKATSAKSKKVFLFCDEFTNYNDTEIGMKAILLLEKLGYEVVIPEHIDSGRALLSKGLIRKAKVIANKNVELLSKIITTETPLLGIEPSAILTFRDEYVDLADDNQLATAKELAKHVFLIDEFIAAEIEKGNISKEMFTKEKKVIQLHGHCQQKSISSVTHSVKKCYRFPKTIRYKLFHPVVVVWQVLSDLKKNTTIYQCK